MLDVVIEYAINGILCVFFQPICSSLCFCFFPPFPLLLSRYKSSLICCVSLGTSLSVSGPALSIWRECISKATGAPPLPPPLLSWPSCPTLYPQPHFTGQFPLIRDALSLFPQKMENCRFIKISLTSIPPALESLWAHIKNPDSQALPCQLLNQVLFDGAWEPVFLTSSQIIVRSMKRKHSCCGSEPCIHPPVVCEIQPDFISDPKWAVSTHSEKLVSLLLRLTETF